MYKYIPFRARNGKATMKKKAADTMWRLGFHRDLAILRKDKKRAATCRHKLVILGNYIPKICFCTRIDVRKELDI